MKPQEFILYIMKNPDKAILSYFIRRCIFPSDIGIFTAILKFMFLDLVYMELFSQPVLDNEIRI